MVTVVPALGTYAAQALQEDPIFILQTLQMVVGSLKVKKDTRVLVTIDGDGTLHPVYQHLLHHMPVSAEPTSCVPSIDVGNIQVIKWITPDFYIGRLGNTVVEVWVTNHVSGTLSHKEMGWIVEKYSLVIRLGLSHLFTRLIGFVSDNGGCVGFIRECIVHHPVMRRHEAAAVKALRTLENHRFLYADLGGLVYNRIHVTSRGVVIDDVGPLRACTADEISEHSQRYHWDKLEEIIQDNEQHPNGQLDRHVRLVREMKPFDILLPQKLGVPYTIGWDDTILKEFPMPYATPKSRWTVYAIRAAVKFEQGDTSGRSYNEEEGSRRRKRRVRVSSVSEAAVMFSLKRHGHSRSSSFRIELRELHNPYRGKRMAHRPLLGPD